jgi:hypothetical protein
MPAISLKGAAVAGLLLLVGTVAAPAGGSKEEAPARLDAVLRDWARARKAHRESHYQFTWTETTSDLFTGTEKKRIYHGEVFLRRPDRLRVVARDAGGELALVAVFVGGTARVYDYRSRRALDLTLPSGRRFPRSAERCAADSPQGLFEGFLEAALWPVLGPPAEEVQRRFTPFLESEDQHWSYIRLRPRKTQGWLPDGEWQVVLHRKEGWLRRVWQGDSTFGRQVTVDFQRPEHGPLPPGIWDPPFRELPEGWRRGAWPLPEQ